MLAHETAARGFRALGWLAFLVAALLVAALFTGGADENGGWGGKLVIVLLPVALGIFYLKIAAGLRRQEDGARIMAIIFACIMLIGIPVGTLVGGYLLFYLNKGYPARTTIAPDLGRPVGGLRR